MSKGRNIIIANNSNNILKVNDADFISKLGNLIRDITSLIRVISEYSA